MLIMYVGKYVSIQILLNLNIKSEVYVWYFTISFFFF